MPTFSSDYQPEVRGTPEQNASGPKKRKVMTDALMVALNREAEAADGKPTKRLTMIADKLAQKAAEGDIQAIKEVFDRTEGKAAQAIIGDPEQPVELTIRWKS